MILPPFCHLRRWILAIALLVGGVSIHAADEPVVFAAYNLENYLTMDRRVTGAGHSMAPKSDEEKAVVLKILQEIHPDILGVCEIGSKEDVDDLQRRLKEAGLDFKHVEYVEGPEERRLALLSRLPIVARNSSADVPWELDGVPQKVRRGFLDVTIEVNKEYQLRLIGAHLKSRRQVPEGEAIIRRHEASLLRQRITKILAEQPETNLLVYGDMNDTKNQPPVQELLGPKGKPDSLIDLWLRDSLGDRWTYYWKVSDEYSRIDFIMVNQALRSEIVYNKSYVYRSPFWNDASDHRPVVTAIRPINAGR